MGDLQGETSDPSNGLETRKKTHEVIWHWENASGCSCAGAVSLPQRRADRTGGTLIPSV